MVSKSSLLVSWGNLRGFVRDETLALTITMKWNNMNSSTAQRIAPLLVLAALMAGWLIQRAHADSITLTTGEIVDGTIVSETTTNLEMEIRKYKGVVQTYDKSQIIPDSIRRSPGAAGKATPAPTTSTQSSDSRTPFSFSGNAFDFVVWLSKTRNAQLSVDPNIVSELAKSDIQIIDATTVPTTELLATQLKAIGLIVKPVSLAPNLTVSFITSPSAWAYYNAISRSKSGDIRSAYSLLADVNADNSEFGEHCTGFKTVLDKIFQRSRDMQQMEAQVHQAIDKFKVAKAGAQGSESFANSYSGTSGKLGEEAARMAKGQSVMLFKQAEDELLKTCNGLLKFDERMVVDNGIVARRFRETDMAHLEYEANFILNHLIAVLTRLREMADLARDAQIAQTTPEFGEITNEIRDMQSEYARVLTSVDGAIRSAVGMLVVNPERAEHTFSESYAIDRSSLLACVGSGYCKILKQIKGLDVLANHTGTSVGTSQKQMREREFRSQQRYGLLQVLDALNSQTTNQPVTIKPGKIGSTKGLAVRLGEGDVFGVSVTISPITHRPTGTASTKKGYWSNLTDQLRAAEMTDEPIEFGDYGAKDPYMIVSAIQAYKWLKSVDEVSQMTKNGNGLKIEFHQIFGGKSGDSAGVTIATSAFSALKHVEVRQDLTMTGSIRADGAVKAVGGVPEKIDGAFREGGIETILVPYENRLDLLAVPADELCRVAIVAANDIRDYLRYATGATTNEATTDKWEAQTALTRLRMAQVLLLLGERTVARELLETVTSEHPEIYNAGRLLELLNKTTNPNSPQVENIISHEDAERAIRRLNPEPLALPGLVTQVTAVSGMNRISLTWSPSPGAAGYVVTRVGENIAHVTTETIFVDSGLSPNIKYCYSVVSSNSVGISAQSPQTCATTRPEQTTPPPSTPPPDAGPWWKYWYVLVGGVLLVGGYFAFRSPG